MNKALICVDVQHDFLPGGALGVPDGDSVIEPLKRLMNDVDIIVLTSDWHPADHSSFANPPEYRDMSWPSHCVAKTDGAEVDDDLWDAAMESGKPVLIVTKGTDKDKEAYSGFQGKVVEVHNVDAHEPRAQVFSDIGEGIGLARALNDLSVRHVKVGGLALDYCVKATAIDSAAHFPDTTVYLDATRPVAYLTGVVAAAELAYKGVRMDGRPLNG